MKKLATLFSDSYREFRQVKTIATLGMFGAISMVLGSLTIVIGDYIKIGFSSIAQQFVYYLFGPAVGGFFLVGCHTTPLFQNGISGSGSSSSWNCICS